MALLLAAVTGVGFAQMEWTYGGELIVRQEYFNNIPIVADPPGVTRNGENHLFRVRPRLWSSLKVNDDVILFGRVVDEFRHYEKPDNDTWDFPDELIVENLYADFTNLLDGQVEVRIGRQDLIYGTGKVLLEGTPLDASRSIYFDAVRVRFKGVENLKVDLLGIYNQPKNQLALGNLKRDLTGYDPAFNDLIESGGGIYASCRRMPEMGMDLYYLFKNETRWINRAGERQPGRETHAVGTRLLPKVSAAVTPELELAYQFGETDDDRDISAYMIDATVKYAIPDTKATVGAGWYHLSGDKPGTDKVEGWNPLWARYPQYSELYVYAFDAEAAAYWSNVSMPNVTCAYMHSDTWTTKALVGYLTAPEANGPGGGDVRGWLATVRTDFLLFASVFGTSDALKAHVVFEVLDPDDYYKVTDAAYYARWEVNYTF
jgi:hypothetical protein